MGGLDQRSDVDCVRKRLTVRAQSEGVLAALIPPEVMLRPIQKLADRGAGPEGMLTALVRVEKGHPDLPAPVSVHPLAVVAVVKAVIAGQLVIGVFLKEEDLLDLAFAEFPSSQDQQCDGRQGQALLQFAGKRFVSSTEVDVENFICGHDLKENRS